MNQKRNHTPLWRRGLQVAVLGGLGAGLVWLNGNAEDLKTQIRREGERSNQEYDNLDGFSLKEDNTLVTRDWKPVDVDKGVRDEDYGKEELLGLAGKIIDESGRFFVMLDPGHGMGNLTKGLYAPGAVVGDVYEERVALGYALKLGETLEDRGYAVAYTRVDNKKNTSLQDRVDVANALGADIFVSLHCDGVEDSKTHGARTYHFPGSIKGENLARCVQDSLIEKLEGNVEGFSQEYDGLREDTFYVLKYTDMPAILVEPGFLTNDFDRKYLMENGDDIVEGIADGIDSYYEDVSSSK